MTATARARRRLAALALTACTLLPALTPVAQSKSPPGEPSPAAALKLWYARPAAAWPEALPVGNGRLGGMVFGGTAQERIQLNEETLWSGGPRDTNNPEALRHLALARVCLIAARPHPVGTQEHAAVRDHIFRELSNLGLAPETQRTTAVNRRWGRRSARARSRTSSRACGARAGERALLLACHYDSAPNSPGASDDGAGVATLLETARALKAGAPPSRDVILLFTDAEEVGLLGAHAFAAEHSTRARTRWRSRATSAARAPTPRGRPTPSSSTCSARTSSTTPARSSSPCWRRRCCCSASSSGRLVAKSFTF